MARRKRFPRRKLRVPKATYRAISKVVNSKLNRVQELKYFNTTAFNVAGIDYSGSFYNLTAIPQGDTDSARDGDKLMLKSLYIRGQTYIAAGGTSNVTRLIIFQWHVDTGAETPAIGDILYTSGSVLTPYSHYQHDQRMKFSVMYDRVFDLNSAGGRNGYQALIKARLNPPRKKISFNAGGTSGTNHVYALAVSDDGAASYPTMSLLGRVYFTDS